MNLICGKAAVGGDFISPRYNKIDFREVFKGESDFAKDTREAAQELINNQPIAYDVDKLVDRLEEYAHSSICKTHEQGCPYLTNDDVSCENCEAMGAVEIVKSGGIE